jgi:ATP-dependent Clp protease ATP-binding subunit ClpB
MNLTRYTEKAHEGMLAAQQLAERSHHPQIEPKHLLITLVEQPDGFVPSVLRRVGVEPARILEDGPALLGRQPEAHGGAEAGPSPRLRAVASLAESEAERLKDEYVSTEHLLLALTL